MEIITPSTKNPLTQPSYGIHIDSNREASITSEHNDTADFRIFSDGSGQEDGIGAAAILFKKHSARPIKTLKYHMGPPTSHNTYEAETVGAILAIWIIKNTVEAIGKTVSLYIDNQALVKALKSTGSKTMAGQYLIDNFKKAARELRCKLTIRWISSHSKVKGNEAADKLAKDAAAGQSSRRENRPTTYTQDAATAQRVSSKTRIPCQAKPPMEGIMEYLTQKNKILANRP